MVVVNDNLTKLFHKKKLYMMMMKRVGRRIKMSSVQNNHTGINQS